MSSTETSINENSEAILLRATKTDVANTYATIASLDATNTNVATAQSTANSAVTKADNAQASIDELEIGGENLLVKSKELTNLVYSGVTEILDNGFTSVKGTDSWKGISFAANDLILKHSIGDKFTFSANVISTSSVKLYFFAICTDSNGERVYPTYSNNEFNSQQFDTTPDYEIDKRYSITFPITQGWIDLIDNGGNIKWTFQFCDASTMTYIYAPKLEHGNKSSDWSPAPEDIENDLTELDSRITIAETSITQNSEVISLKAEKTEVETAKTEAISSANSNTTNLLKDYSTTSEMNAAIELKAESINSSVSGTYATKESLTDVESDVESVEARMTTAESSITQLSNKVTSNIAETNDLGTRMSTVEQTSDDLTIELSNLKIGGENILIGSKEISKVCYGNTETTLLDNGFYAAKCTGDWCGIGFLANDLISECSEGDKFTFSVNMISTTAVQIHFYAMCYDSTGSRVYPTYSVGQLNNKTIATAPDYEEDKRYSITFPVTQGWIDLINAGGKITWTFQISGGASSDTPVYLYAPKLERGNKATDWSPNPDDIYSRLDTADANIITAQSTADTAKTNAANAAKTATNYLNFSNSGLVIGDMTASSLGENVLIDSNSVDVRNGTTVLASFGADTIYLGKNSETSIINLCNGSATMKVKDDTDFRIYTDKRLVMSAYKSMLLDCYRDSTHQSRISIQSSDPDDTSFVGGVNFWIYQDNIQNTVSMLKNNIELQVTDGTNETRFNVDEKIIKAYAAERIRLNSVKSVQIAESSNYAAGILLGNNYTVAKTISCYWSDGSIHDLISNGTNGQKSYFGPADIDQSTITYIRGNDVRIYAHSGGVYLGASGSTTVTSDRNLKKDILDIDDKYMTFFDNLRPITYKYDCPENKGHRDHIGFVAQEVEEALLASGLTTEQFAGLVIEKDVTLSSNYDSSLSDEENSNNETHYDTLYSLRYEEFISLLVKKVQDLQKQINEMKGE